MYATAQNMIDRFGLTEILRLSALEDRTATEIDEAKINIALGDATSTIDSFLRGKYALPVAQAPDSLVRACCILARHDLAVSGRSDPSEQMIDARKEIMGFLKQVADNIVSLDIPRANQSAAATSGPGARFSDRPSNFSNDQLKDW